MKNLKMMPLALILLESLQNVKLLKLTFTETLKMLFMVDQVVPGFPTRFLVNLEDQAMAHSPPMVTLLLIVTAYSLSMLLSIDDGNVCILRMLISSWGKP